MVTYDTPRAEKMHNVGWRPGYGMPSNRLHSLVKVAASMLAASLQGSIRQLQVPCAEHAVVRRKFLGQDHHHHVNMLPKPRMRWQQQRKHTRLRWVNILNGRCRIVTCIRQHAAAWDRPFSRHHMQNTAAMCIQAACIQQHPHPATMWHIVPAKHTTQPLQQGLCKLAITTTSCPAGCIQPLLDQKTQKTD